MFEILVYIFAFIATILAFLEPRQYPVVKYPENEQELENYQEPEVYFIRCQYCVEGYFIEKQCRRRCKMNCNFGLCKNPQ